jgi:hypothetical protein
VARDLTSAEAEVFKRLRSFLAAKTRRNIQRRNFLEAKHRLNGMGIEIPPGMERFATVLDWPKKAVTAFTSRLIPRGYSSIDNEASVSVLNDVLTRASYDTMEPQAIKAAGEYGVSFVFTTLGDLSQNEPPVIVTPRSGLSATAEIDRRTQRVISALEKVDRSRYNLYLPGRVLTIDRRDGVSAPQVVNEWDHSHRTMSVQCAPYSHDPTLSKPFGQSRVSETVMGLTMAGMRTLLRQEVAAQFYMAPRFALLGADDSIFEDEHGNKRSLWSFIMGEIWAMPDIHPDDEPDVEPSQRRVDFHEFSQLSMQPFSDQYRLIAGALSGATSLPLPYLGVNHDANPSSAEAMHAHEADLVREVRTQTPHLSAGRKTLALNVLSLVESTDFWSGQHDLITDLTPRWEDPRTRSMSEMSQMTALQVQAGNLQPGSKTTLKQLPMSAEDIEAAVEENKRAAGSGVLEQVLNGSNGPSLAEQAEVFTKLIGQGVTVESAAQIASGQAGLESAEFNQSRVDG